jgi:hypothetical protein
MSDDINFAHQVLSSLRELRHLALPYSTVLLRDLFPASRRAASLADRLESLEVRLLTGGFHRTRHTHEYESKWAGVKMTKLARLVADICKTTATAVVSRLPAVRSGRIGFRTRDYVEVVAYTSQRAKQPHGRSGPTGDGQRSGPTGDGQRSGPTRGGSRIVAEISERPDGGHLGDICDTKVASSKDGGDGENGDGNAPSDAVASEAALREAVATAPEKKIVGDGSQRASERSSPLGEAAIWEKQPNGRSSPMGGRGGGGIHIAWSVEETGQVFDTTLVAGLGAMLAYVSGGLWDSHSFAGTVPPQTRRLLEDQFSHAMSR